MTPKTYFDAVWSRSDLIAALHDYLAPRVTGALQPDELLRAEWASRISALDLYIHELVAQNLLKIFEGTRPTCPGFTKLQISGDGLLRIQNGSSATDRSTAFDLDVRTRLSRLTFQYPDDIADGIRLISPCKIWNEVSLKCGATAETMSTKTEAIKTRLSIIVDRRNKIVHEGDLQPTAPRIPWPISKADVSDVATFIKQIVEAIDKII